MLKKWIHLQHTEAYAEVREILGVYLQHIKGEVRCLSFLVGLVG